MTTLILGGGISGLSAAYFLQKRDPSAKMILLEEKNRLGGWIETGPFQMEKGPRTFPVGMAPSLLSLIEELGLKDEVIYSDPAAEARFVWHRGRLRSVRSLLVSFFPAMLCELFRKKQSKEDESIYDFASRRFSRKMAEMLFDPMTLGIFGGDIHRLSLRSCFPALYAMEQKNGSIVRSFLKIKRKGQRLFTLQRGVDSLIEALEKRLRIQIVRGARVDAIRSDGVMAGGQLWPAERVISALPGHVLGKLTGLWPDFSSQSLWVVNAAFHAPVFPKAGFGYLVPSQENEALLGMIWDSSIFPGQNKEGLHRLTAMVRPIGDASWAESVVLDLLKRHLKSASAPFFLQMQKAELALPQFHVGYRERLAQFQRDLAEHYPHLTPIGNYLEGGPSVEACIARAKLC